MNKIMSFINWVARKLGLERDPEEPIIVPVVRIETGWTGHKEEKKSIPKQLVLKRLEFSDRSTIGELWIDSSFQCYTLEDTVRKIKIPKETAIPSGSYEVVITYSHRFLRRLPLLLDVPGFTHIRIHPGNKPDNTEGCILPGLVKGHNFVGQSIPAFDKLFSKIEKLLETQKVYLHICGG